MVQDHIIADHKRSKINATQSPKLRKAYNFHAKRGWSEPGLQWSCRRSESTSPAVGGREGKQRWEGGARVCFTFTSSWWSGPVSDVGHDGLTTVKFWSYREHLWSVRFCILNPLNRIYIMNTLAAGNFLPHWNPTWCEAKLDSQFAYLDF